LYFVIKGNLEYKVLAIETSCDDTAVAIIDTKKNILANIVQSQYDIHREYNGIVPELASRHHLENINFILDEAFKISNLKFKDIDAVAVTVKPGLAGSLLVGAMTAKTIGFVLQKPVIPIDHLKAHIWANFLKYTKNGQIFIPEFPALVLLVSGGHTNLYLMNSFKDAEIILLGETRDDAVGEAFDKIGKLLNLGYPGGPIIDKITKNFQNVDLLKLPKPVIPNSFDFSFSGLKTAVLYLTKSFGDKITITQKKIIAASFQNVAIEVLVKKIKKATEKYNIKTIMLSGGVAANSQLRNDVKEFAKTKNLISHFPPVKFCTDNAAMVGSLAIDLINEFGFDYFIEKNKDIDFLKIYP
jgi:N6-L-threonylcarbamoyladenine synthase